jgi:nitrogen fixation NifU-like protein
VKGKSVAQAQEITGEFKAMMNIHGESLEDVSKESVADAELKLGDLEALKGVVKFPVRIKCATLSWNTLAQAIEEATAS